MKLKKWITRTRDVRCAMSTCKHRQCVERANRLLFHGEWDYEPTEALIDMLADLLHWAHAKGLDFDGILRTARNHFDFEINPENEEDLRAEMETGALLLVDFVPDEPTPEVTP